MTEPHTIALIVDPECGERIREVAAGVRHTWVVTSDVNDAVVERIWRESRLARTFGAEGGVTRFDRHGDDPASWCDSILDAIEDHHGSLTRQHGYTALDVRGVALSARLRSSLVECGFSVFTPTNEGFVAGK